MPEVIYNGPFPEVSFFGGFPPRQHTVKQGGKVKVHEDLAKSLCEQKDSWKLASASAPKPADSPAKDKE